MQTFIDLVIIHLGWRLLTAPLIADLIKRLILGPFGKVLKKHFVKTEREFAIWMHYKNKALNKGHNHKRIEDCDDGKCLII